MSEKNKTYNPKNTEKEYYKLWEERGYFELDGNKGIQKKGKNFAIMMPPPNITGVLHVGHAFTFTLQDIITRYKRMDGYKTLWQPGIDHAGIATQNIVEKQLLEKGIKKEDIGREEFLKRVWEWKELSGTQIFHQMRKLGVSPVWSRARFTMDEGLQKAVKKSFANLYNKGLIERGNYMVNWCTKDGALSDIEVEYENNKGKLYHLKYPIEGSGEYVVVATTRPETYFGDSAVMVHPDDERYAHLVGKNVTLPLINRKIKIITDKHVDMEFGTGCVKVTPAHDINDYEVGQRHKLEYITVFDEDGILNGECGEFEGLERLEARTPIVDALHVKGFVEKIEDYDNQVGHCYRCKNIVEPYISKQWFVKTDIAKGAIAKTNEGESQFYPAHWINSFNAWMRELRPWCISRQLWWGHQIPVWYCDDCGHQWASEEIKEDKCPKCASLHVRQDEDVLDTWFSSGLWAFSTLGWGNGDFGKGTLWNESDLKDFYPNSLLITGFDILFFWVARMMFQSEENFKKLPFKDIYLHALVKDEFGQKMSKSKGNSIDPLEMIEKYSADTLRFTLALLAVQGRDIKLSEEKMEQVRNFTNKLYNASKFLLMKEQKFQDLQNITIDTQLGLYMYSRFAQTTKEVRENLEAYRFNDAANSLYRFLWGEFCDWGIELAKCDNDSVKELGAIFKEAMKLLHPFMPFLSEHLYHTLSATSLKNGESIMVSKYPDALHVNKECEAKWELIKQSIVSIRRAKATIELANQKIKKAFIKIDTNINISENSHFITKLAKCEEIEFTTQNIKNSARDVSDNLEVFIPLDGVDLGGIISRLQAQELKTKKEFDKLNAMLSNEKFVTNAPKEVVQENQKLLENAKTKLAKIKEELGALNA